MKTYLYPWFNDCSENYEKKQNNFFVQEDGKFCFKLTKPKTKPVTIYLNAGILKTFLGLIIFEKFIIFLYDCAMG